MSFLAWIDFDQVDRDRTRRIMDLFGEEDSRDELGLGSIRDALSDLMFPGTSTIQTRLRYMFFVPWIYKNASVQKGSSASRAEFARAQEIKLIHALETGGETVGVIGSEARERLKRLPSDVYWAGLGVLGIRLFHGGRTAYMDAHSDGAERHEVPSLWAPGLPHPQEGWLESTSFRLTLDEADFFIDRLTGSANDSLLTELARSGEVADCSSIWSHPNRSALSASNRELVDHAERFSTVMHGASLLYNLLLSERAAQAHGEPDSVWHGRISDYRQRLGDWAEVASSLPLKTWPLEDLWSRAASTMHRVTPLTMRFVSEWLDVVRQTEGHITDNAPARGLVEMREMKLKGSKSRFRNAAALGRWNGASGTLPLNYRWPIVTSHLRDLANAG